MKKKFGYLIASIVLVGITTTGCMIAPEHGLLQGKVYIGPVSPVEQPGQSTTLPCNVYKPRKIMVYDHDGSRLVTQVDIECNSEGNYARYRVELQPGTYTIDINHIGVDSSQEVPAHITVEAGITYRLDINIDTGIR